MKPLKIMIIPFVSLPLLFLLSCAAEIPNGPNVSVMPGAGKPFEAFQQDNAICMNFAQQQIGVNPNGLAQENTVNSAATGALVGAAAGTLIGDNSRSAATGAGVGLLVGSAAGNDQANRVSSTLQQRYDIAYEQCMYAKGNQILGYSSPPYLLPPPPQPIR